MTNENPFSERPFAPSGDSSSEALYTAVGQALNNWEHAENSFAHLFGTIIRPGRNSYAARRAYGSIVTARGRKEMLGSVIAVFFRNFPNEAAEQEAKALLNRYQVAAARRNELAHGIVGGDRDEDGQFLGHFVVPSIWNTNKRGLDSGIKYRYSTKEINLLLGHFTNLGGQAIDLADRVDEIFRTSSERLQQRW